SIRSHLRLHLTMHWLRRAGSVTKSNGQSRHHCAGLDRSVSGGLISAAGFAACRNAQQSCFHLADGAPADLRPLYVRAEEGRNSIGNAIKCFFFTRVQRKTQTVSY